MIPVETNSKCSGSTIPGFGTPRIEDCLKYSGSTFHIYMKMEPPIHKAVSKVYLSYLIFLTLNLNNFVAVETKFVLKQNLF